MKKEFNKMVGRIMKNLYRVYMQHILKTTFKNIYTASPMFAGSLTHDTIKQHRVFCGKENQTLDRRPKGISFRAGSGGGVEKHACWQRSRRNSYSQKESLYFFSNGVYGKGFCKKNRIESGTLLEGSSLFGFAGTRPSRGVEEKQNIW